MLGSAPQKIPNHFSKFILDEYEIRRAKNSSYSLRAFARDLDISSGKLSDIISRKVGISGNTALKLTNSLKLSKEDESLFLNLVEMNSLKDSDKKNNVYNYDSKYVVLTDDYHKVLTEWYYFALVELVALETFQNDDEWISKKLGIDVNLVRTIIERLKRVELITESNGVLTQTYDFFVSPSGTPLDAAKKFHRQILAKAHEAIEEQRIEERDFTSGFLRVRKADLPYVAQKIKEFRRTLVKELEEGDGHDSVYAFSIQFFRGDRDH